MTAVAVLAGHEVALRTYADAALLAEVPLSWRQALPASRAVNITRAIAPTMTTAGGGGAALVSDEGAPAAAEFLEVVRQVPIVGRLAGLRRMPQRTRILIATGAVAHWVGEARGKPVSSMAFVAASCRR